MPRVINIDNTREVPNNILSARDGKGSYGRLKLHDAIGINCSTERAEKDFAANDFAHEGYDHMPPPSIRCILSVGPLESDNLSAKEAHVYTQVFLEKINERFGGHWQIVAYSHKDHLNSYHYHVFIDDYNLKTGDKFHIIYRYAAKIRHVNEAVSLSFGLDPKKRNPITKNMSEVKINEQAERSSSPYYIFQDHVRALLSRAMLESNNISEFRTNLLDDNIELRSNFFNDNKNGTIVIPGQNPRGDYEHDKQGDIMQRKVRTNKLGSAFDKRVILRQLSLAKSQRSPKYMDVYKNYLHFKGQDDVPMAPKTSSEYLYNNILRGKFRTNWQMNYDASIKKIIHRLNERFARQNKQNLMKSKH